MNTILCLTDLSETANHAVRYGYEIAKKMEARIIICNVINIPAEIPQYEVVMWPLKNFDKFEDTCKKALKKIKDDLEQNDQSTGFHPPINCVCESGTVADIVFKIENQKKINLIVMGTHAGSGLKHLLFGNHTKYLIDSASAPLLLVPPQIKSNRINWIGFATDLNPEDISFICKLIEFGTYMNTEIILQHIHNKTTDSEVYISQRLEEFLSQLKNKCHYSRISCQYMSDKSVISGLEKLCRKNGNNGLLAMVHKNTNYISEILKGSHTKKMAKRLFLPLLVISSKNI